jgi:hypothetical protein
LLLVAAVLPVSLSGCFQNANSGGPGTPGTFSYYSQVSFANAGDFCDSDDDGCFYQVHNNFGSPMIANGWTQHNGLTDGNLGGVWTTTPTQESQIIGDTSNLVYFSTHGLVNGGNSWLCLEQCNNLNHGGDMAVSTLDIPSSWHGPTWLIIDGCDVVTNNAGWNAKFGGNLHGILGFNQDVQSTGSATAIGAAGLEAMATDIQQYQTAIQDWDDATGAADITPLVGMLVPSANQSDVIEAPGGPNFGPNGSTLPNNFVGESAASVAAVQQTGLAPAGATYTLTGETVDESTWLSNYGNPTGTKVNPSANEHEFLSPTATVTHYVKSGGIVARTPESGTAGAITQSAAYQYAQTYVGNNGGIPADAVLTYAGRVTNPNADAIRPPGCEATCQIPASAYPAHNDTRLWTFIWRHKKNGILWGDKIQVNVDDGGSWTVVQQPCGGRSGIPQFCIEAPWIPAAHVSLYSRVWRTVGAVKAQVSTIALPNSLSLDPTATKSATGLCSPDMASTTMVAVPCQQYTSANGDVRSYMSLVDGSPIGSN